MASNRGPKAHTQDTVPASILKGGAAGSGKKREHRRGGAPRKAPMALATSSTGSSGAIFNVAGADTNIVRSGHSELNTLWASNDVVTGPITVNVCNAPNNSTMQCGCENINCPFCNLMLSIESTDPTVLQ